MGSGGSDVLFSIIEKAFLSPSAFVSWKYLPGIKKKELSIDDGRQNGSLIFSKEAKTGFLFENREEEKTESCQVGL